MTDEMGRAPQVFEEIILKAEGRDCAWLRMRSIGNREKMSEYISHNKETIARWVTQGWEWSIPLTHTDFIRAKAGDFYLLLTPMRPVPPWWLGGLAGKRVLALASGGGQQGPILTALGARVTVFDFSKEQLQKEREVAEREGYAIELVEGDMTKPLSFDDAVFDMIVHPVSNCYIEKVEPVWRECARVLKTGVCSWRDWITASILLSMKPKSIS